MPDAIISGLQPPAPSPYTYQPGATPVREPGRFGRIFGGILGGALNVVAPGVGSIIGGILRGGNLPGLADAEMMLPNSITSSYSFSPFKPVSTASPSSSRCSVIP